MSIAFSPDGKTLATGSMDRTAKLWSVEIGQEFASLKGHRGPVSGLAFSHDGTILASSSEDNTIRPHSSLGYRPPAPETIYAWSDLARRSLPKEILLK